MRWAVLLLVPLMLTGCTSAEFSLGGPTLTAPSDAEGTVAPLEVLAAAEEAAEAWNHRAILLMVSGEATEEVGSFFSAPKAKHPLFADGRMQVWKFSFVVPGTVAMFAVDVDADGTVVGDRKLDLSSMAPDTSAYGEYFAMTPIEPAWLNMTLLLDALRANDTVNPFVGGRSTLIQYALVPDVRDLYAWRVTIRNDAGLLKAEVNPATWEIYSVQLDGADGSFVRYEVTGFSTLPSGLSIERVWGERESEDADVSRIGFYVELSGAGRPVGLEELGVLYARDGEESLYAWRGNPGYEAKWLRGGKGDAVVRPGDLVSISLGLEEPLPTRTSFGLALLPPKGSPVERDVRTPTTYGTGLTVDLE